jgi:preprotein translocase subunit SecF
VTPASSTTEAPAPEHHRHTLKDLYHERTHFQFIDHSRRWAILSGTLILISVLAFAVQGLNLGIDFEGGTQLSFTVARGSADSTKVRDALKPLGLGDAKVLIVGGKDVRVQVADLKPAEQAKAADALAKYAGIDAQAVSVDRVGPTWGDRVSSKALQALLVFLVVIALYLTFRFEWRMALAALIAVLHDIVITVGVYAVTQFEVTPATVVAFLTILGYSLYDTVVVFDKIKDNQSRIGTVRGDTYSKMVNRSLNQVLMRSINTSIVALLPVASLLFVGTYVFGGLVLRDFALALFVGLLTGAYSSIFVATPVVAWLKEREPRYRALRARAEAELARAPEPAPKAAPKPANRSAPKPAPASASVATDQPDDDASEALLSDDVEPAVRPDEVKPDDDAPVPSTPSASGPTRGAANPRPRTNRGRKRR